MVKPLLCSFLLCLSLVGFTQDGVSDTTGGLEFYIHEEVSNAGEEIEQQIIELWRNYLLEGRYTDTNSPYWSFENMAVPDESLWALGVESLQTRKYKIQCKVIGVFKVENDYWSLITSFSHVDDEGEIYLDIITAVYAKEFNGEYLLISSAEYLKTVLEHKKVGSINYYIHPFHSFQQSEADEMMAFNEQMAKEFGVEPLELDYFVSSNARDICRVWGYEYMNRMYNPSGKGGVASWRNMTIYSGNNSSFYPHELVHLYTFHMVPRDPHFWVGEGIGTFYGGTATYTFHGHQMRLKEFLAENPHYDLSDINELNITIPNGEYASDFRYVIGSLLMSQIYENEGVGGLVEALDYGAEDEDFYRLLKDKLGVEQGDLDTYVKELAANYEGSGPEKP